MGASTSIAIATTPESEALDVDRTDTVSAQFGEDILVTSVSDNSLTLSADGQPVDGALQFDAQSNILAFTPEKKLPKSTRVEATVDEGVADIEGNVLGAEYRWSFMTEGASWGDGEVLQVSSGPLSNLQFAANDDGDTLVVWVQNQHVFASRFDAASGNWLSAERVGSNAGATARPHAAMSPTGDAVVIWNNADDGALYARRWSTLLGSWESERRVGNLAGEADYPQVAMDAQGNALAVWQQRDGQALSIFAGRLSAGSENWAALDRIDTHPDESHQPTVAMTADGEAVVVWRQRVSAFGSLSTFDVHANRLVSGVWQGVAALGDGVNSVASPQVAVDSAGRAFVVWRQNDGGSQGIYATSTTESGHWGVAERIGIAGASVTRPDIAADGPGNAFVVWQRYDNSGSRIQVNRFSSGWQGATTIQANLERADMPSIATSGSGDAVVVWSQREGSGFFAEARTYVASEGGWGSITRLSGASIELFAPEIVMAPNADAVAGWVEVNDGGSALQTNRYD
ncbi:Ig-like domain-containing protein [Marinobacter sp. F4216]|uniref:Ig-like domain-containing protein n=1 Tax=Marinobacter sp. F4216 TaxID=2874281 RepID=UPI001CBCBC3B|nr:Ig-like domain-containing protein [Marinobacter sp. F4216]MBZ2167239.1 Ig-like domain-containing protein [Marinobacter sp. F4216]